MKAISYIRFSSSIQERGTSLQRQQELIDKWLSNNPDIPLSDMQFNDLGLSGYKGTHLEHGFGQLLLAIQNKKISRDDRLLVENIDRLGRLQSSVMLELIMGIINAGVIIVTLQDGIEYDQSSLDGGQLYILAGKIQQAHDESEKKSVRIKASWKIKKTVAKSGGQIKRKAPWYISKDNITGIYNVITEDNRVLVTNIFTWYLNGISQNEIVRRLKETSEQFNTYSPTALKKLMVNKTAIGYWGDIPNVYPQIITETLFYSVQSEIQRRSANKFQGKHSNHIMAGLVKCGECGSNYSVRNQKHSSTVMVCTNSTKKSCTNTKTIPIDVLNEFRVATQASYIQSILDSEMDAEKEDEIIIIDGRLKDFKKQKDNIIKLIRLTGDESLATELLEVNKHIGELESKKAGVTESITSKISYASLVNKGLHLGLDQDELNGMLRKSGFKISVVGKVITLNENRWEYKRHYMGVYEVIEDGQLFNVRKSKNGLTGKDNVMKLMTKK